jgi:hypothetical protein
MAGGGLCGRWGIGMLASTTTKSHVATRSQVDNLMRLVGGKNWRDYIAPQR